MPYLLRRLLHALFLLFGVSVLTFILANAVPGDFYASMRLNPRVSNETLAVLRMQHGLGDPLSVRYARWLRSIFQGEWGYSLAYDSPAGPILRVRSCNTLLLTGSATLAAWLLALPLGIVAAFYRHRWFDWLTGIFSASLLATPELILGLLLLLFAARTSLLPVGGFTSLQVADEQGWSRIADLFRHLLLPGVCLTAGLFPVLFSFVRNAVAESLSAPFITAARSYGIPSLRLVLRHALPAAANPLISLFGLSLGMLLSSSLLIETLFSWPGLGQLLVEAIFQRDFFLVIDATLLAACLFVAGSFVADVMLYAADPRIRTA